MPAVRAFRGLGYALDRFGEPTMGERIRQAGEAIEHPGRVADLSDVVCPPYDVISDEQRATLLARHPHNAVRLEASAEPDPYRAAADTLEAWRDDGTLTRAAAPSVYYYEHASSQQPDELLVQGVVVRLLLEEWGTNIRPHERTMAGPKADRARVLEATGTQLSPILAVYFDRSERYRHVMSRPWSSEWRARDGDGLLHRLAAVEADERLVNFLARQRLVVADGHHRYETALAHRDGVRSDPGRGSAPPGSLPSDWVMAVLVNAALEEVEIRATHRLVRGVDPGALRSLVDDPGELWDVGAVAAADLPAAVGEHDGDAPVFGLGLQDGGAYLMTARGEALEVRMRRERASTAVRRLDLAALHAALFADRLGLDPDAAGDRIFYTKDPADALDRVAAGEAQAAFLVRPTRVEQLAAVARAGDLMPQKSTYFYPKLLTGMVFYPLEE